MELQMISAASQSELNFKLNVPESNLHKADCADLMKFSFWAALLDPSTQHLLIENQRSQAENSRLNSDCIQIRRSCSSSIPTAPVNGPAEGLYSAEQSDL